jgi:hypothetical protein
VGGGGGGGGGGGVVGVVVSLALSSVVLLGDFLNKESLRALVVADPGGVGACGAGRLVEVDIVADVDIVVDVFVDLPGNGNGGVERRRLVCGDVPTSDEADSLPTIGDDEADDIIGVDVSDVADGSLPRPL